MPGKEPTDAQLWFLLKSAKNFPLAVFSMFKALEKRLVAFVNDFFYEHREEIRGFPGNDGLPGVDGKDGKPGPEGPEGAPGAPGKDGKDGNDGRDGKDGKDGEKGKIGPKGAKGEKGPAGKDGKDGMDGKDGSPDSGKEIVKKVNDLPLTPSNQIDASHIKNIPAVFSGMSAQRKFASSSITDFGEAVDDRVSSLIRNGTGISWTYDDAANTLTPAVSLSPFSTTDLAEGVNLYFTDERAQDAVGAMVDATLVYVDATPLLTRGAITGDVSVPQASNTATIANDAVTYAKMQNVSSNNFVLGRITAGAGNVEELTGANIATIANASFDHGTLLGNGDDDHTQYALLLGRSGGQTLIGGTASGNDLTLQSTSHATKGNIFFGTSTYDEVNNRLGVGTNAPSFSLHVSGSTTGNFSGIYVMNTNGFANTESASIGIARDATHEMGRLTASNEVSSTFENGYLAFGTRTAESITEKMRITSNGFVGIGTASPSVQFEQSKTTVNTFTDFVGSTISGVHHVITTTTDSGFTSPIRNAEFDLVANLSSNPLAAKNAFACFAGTAIPSGNAVALGNLTIGGLNFNAAHNGSGAISGAFGVTGVITQGGGGSMTNAFCLDALILNTSGTMSNAYGLRVRNLTNTGTITQYYGVYVGTITGGTLSNTPYSFYAAESTAFNYFAGNVGIGTTAPKGKLHIEGTPAFLIQDESDANPTATELDANDSIAVYNKANKFVIAYNNAGTITYISIPLNGSTTTWTHSTTAP